jgi:hypothetical protein
LLQLATKLILAQGEDSRLTIYIHNGQNSFISFGRYSPNPLLNKKGRPSLPEHEGCIGRAWQNAWCFEGDLTQRLARKDYKVSKASQDVMRMKSKFYAAKRIDAQNIAIAILVFESMNPNRFQENHIKDILDKEEPYLANLLEGLRCHIPDPTCAARKGY